LFSVSISAEASLAVLCAWVTCAFNAVLLVASKSHVSQRCVFSPESYAVVVVVVVVVVLAVTSFWSGSSSCEVDSELVLLLLFLTVATTLEFGVVPESTSLSMPESAIITAINTFGNVAGWNVQIEKNKKIPT